MITKKNMQENKKAPENEKLNQILGDVLKELRQEESVKEKIQRGTNETLAIESIADLDRSISISKNHLEIMLVKNYAI